MGELFVLGKLADHRLDGAKILAPGRPKLESGGRPGDAHANPDSVRARRVDPRELGAVEVVFLAGRAVLERHGELLARVLDVPQAVVSRGKPVVEFEVARRSGY